MISPSFMMGEICWHDLRCTHAEIVDFYTSNIMTLLCEYVLDVHYLSVGGL